MKSEKFATALVQESFTFFVSHLIMGIDSPYSHKNSPLYVKSAEFSKRIIRMVKYLGALNKDISSMLNQVMRSGTSIYANVGESQFAQTPADFIAKLHISLKEANETATWLDMLYSAQVITKKQFDSMSHDLNEIIAILIASLKTAKRNNN